MAKARPGSLCDVSAAVTERARARAREIGAHAGANCRCSSCRHCGIWWQPALRYLLCVQWPRIADCVGSQIGPGRGSGRVADRAGSRIGPGRSGRVARAGSRIGPGRSGRVARSGSLGPGRSGRIRCSCRVARPRRGVGRAGAPVPGGVLAYSHAHVVAGASDNIRGLAASIASRHSEGNEPPVHPGPVTCRARAGHDHRVLAGSLRTWRHRRG